jgi:hypothetical protein
MSSPRSLGNPTYFSQTKFKPGADKRDICLVPDNTRHTSHTSSRSSVKCRQTVCRRRLQLKQLGWSHSAAATVRPLYLSKLPPPSAFFQTGRAGSTMVISSAKVTPPNWSCGEEEEKLFCVVDICQTKWHQVTCFSLYLIQFNKINWHF